MVSNDGIDLMIGYQAVVNHNLVDHKQYKCETYVKIYINYTKVQRYMYLGNWLRWNYRYF